MKRKMSRFVLRSNAEQTKLSEQKEKSKSLTNPLKTSTKKVDNKKGSKSCTAPKGPSQTDSSTTVTCHKAIPAAMENNELEEKRDGRISIICSLPLSRLSGLIEKLSIKTPQNHIKDAQIRDTHFTKPPASQTLSSVSVDPGGDDDDGEEKQSVFDDDTSNSKSQDQETMNKTLCLYCDKQFNTKKIQQKHIEKFHWPQKDRRCSVRNSQLLVSPRSKSGNRQSASNRMTYNYPGCTFCKKLKLHESSDPVRDFNGLFLHLTEHHADKYFGCKICVLRFQNIGKLIKHMQIVHNKLPEAQLKLSKDYEVFEETRLEPASPLPADKSQQQQTKQQRHSLREHESPASSSLLDQSDAIGVEDTILTRLGLTQNRRRMPSNRKGVRLRRDSAVPDMLLKSEGTMSSSVTTALLAASPSKSRNKVATKGSITAGSSDLDAVVFRVPARTSDISSTIFDENFYKEVTANVRNNLLFHLDGKLEEIRDSHTTERTEVPPIDSQMKSLPLLLRSTLAPTVAVQGNLESNLQETEIHVATNLSATTAFPTLLTAEQYCGDARKIRRPHTKHSWKWKWDSVKKYKLINEGGKIVKKAKHSMLGLRDLSKLDMWTQLSMRQKHEKELIALQNASNFDDFPSGEKRRLNDQLNVILDTRVLPHIILEQSEQAIIKLENEESPFSADTRDRSVDGRDDDEFFANNIVGQTFSDENFLSLLQLLPRSETRNPERKVVLSGEWARPRCYMCMCCGNRFEKLKSLEEHKTFRHSNIFSTHYEVVGRELLAGNLLQYLFIPKRALSYYSAPPAAIIPGVYTIGTGSAKKLMKYRRINVAAEEESSDSVQSVSNSYAPEQRAFSLKNVASTTDDCDTDTKTTLLGDMNTVSPSHSFQSTFSSSLTANSNQSGCCAQPIKQHHAESNKDSIVRNWNCSKCSRKCNGMSDLYRHMLDCSGDYVWSLAKKRKYRYYCGSKKRRQLHRQHSSESRKNKPDKTSKSQTIENCTTEESSSNSYKPKTPPRPRPSDAESIKKMLENLPPKRVCKTIFPAVNKAKKTKKPKFVTKLYNTKILRKTRARQLSNAVKRTANARFAAKAKAKASQSKALNPIKCKTRKNMCPTKQTNAAKSEPSTTTDAKSKAENESEKLNNTKKDQVLNLLQGGEAIQNVEININGEKKEANKALNHTANNLMIQKENSGKSNKEQDFNKSIASTEDTTETIDTRVEENNVTTNAEENDHQKFSKATPQIADTSACNRKRSKRISDCIAMLTGKLEEKLKTESTTYSSTKNEESLESTESKPATAEKEKKAPKRKTISRRIIKNDVDIHDVTNSVSITTVGPVEVTTSIVKTTVTAVSAKISKTNVTPSGRATTKTIMSNGKPSPTPIAIGTPIKEPPITLTPSAPAKVILPSPVTPPTLVPITMPLATALHAVPVPLKVLQGNLPVFIPPQNLGATPVALTAPLPPVQPTPTPAAVLPLPLLTSSNTSATLLPAPITLLPPAPLLQAHISPAPTTSAALCSMEPLNLTNAKSAKKQTTAELRAQRPGFPARRQTICGFEARDLLAFNDMEPLDLSVKSRAPTAESSSKRTIAKKPTYASIDFSATAQLAPLTLPPPSSQNTATNSAMQADELIIKPSNSIAQTPIASFPMPPIPPQTLPTTASETLFNKQFYSNLDLLKIPQIRATGFLPTVETLNTLTNGMMTSLPVQTQSASVSVSLPTVTVTCSNVNEMLSQAQTQLLISAQTQQQQQQVTTQTQPQKANNKKRANSKSSNIDLSPNTPTAAAASLTPTKSKETNASTKKDGGTKQKPVTKMDEEVINHIDDAINSVINAVKASLYESEQQQQQQQQQQQKQHQVMPHAKLESSQTTVSTMNLELENKITKQSVMLKNESIEPLTKKQTMSTLILVETTTTATPVTATPTTAVEPITPTITNTTTKHPNTSTTTITISNLEPFTSTKTFIDPTTTIAEPIATTSMELNKISAETLELTTPVTNTTAVITEPTKTMATTLTSALKPSLPLMPKKRSLRSKTMDCRSQLKEVSFHSSPNRNEILCSPLTQHAAKQIKKQENTNNKLLSKSKTLEIHQVNDIEEKAEFDKPNKTAETSTKGNLENNAKTENETPADKIKINDKSNKKINNMVDKKEASEAPNETLPKAAAEVTIATSLQDSSMHVNLITHEENINNIINNTSSGFHSSSTPENAGDVKKKQRRRRKNELAAIVADQLLESFKIDKARRDSLKKLENMAYEKSEDLLLTGMLLMSSTKRSASSAICFNQNTEKRNENTKRLKQQDFAAISTSYTTNTTARPKSRNNKVDNDQNYPADIQKPVKSSNILEPQVSILPDQEVIIDEDKTNNKIQEITQPRRGRRGRPTRRKGGVKTPLDNENLSKLKSSLESFSIGIEKQLSEFEARNSTAAVTTKVPDIISTKNVFNNVDVKAKKKKSTTAAIETISNKPTTNSYILRPSILAATLEQTQAATKEEATKFQIEIETRNEQTKEMKTTTPAIPALQGTGTTAATNFSRDPRLNKNIHKDENSPIANAKQNATTTPICDIEDDNYLTEIAKNVNEKIMAAENEDFAFADDDGFEIGTEFNDDDDDSNSKYSRPPTSMSVRSAPNFNDDHSNFGSICEENTNTEVMDMDLDDELSVYTSFSQDLGRGRGRKRRRRRSILLKRRPKKRRSSQDLPAEKFECDLCKKTFFAAASLSKHNMTLAHVSKVSEREYLMSKSGEKDILFNDSFTNAFPKKRTTTSAARRKRAQSMNLEIFERSSFFDDEKLEPTNVEQLLPIIKPKSPLESQEKISPQKNALETPPTKQQMSSQRLSMNPDERLFYECCNILKSADTTRMARTEQENDNDNQNSFLYPKAFVAPPSAPTEAPLTDAVAAALNKINNTQSLNQNHVNLLSAQTTDRRLQITAQSEHVPKHQETMKNPILRPSCLQKVLPTSNPISTIERHAHSPTYSQFSAVTNTTQSRFKTKAAMKGYENGNADITIQTQTHEMKSRPTCKLTELADIALGHDDKSDTPAVPTKASHLITINTKRAVTPEYITLSVVDGRKVDGVNFSAAIQENNKMITAESQGSTSSKTIMHSSIIKAAVEEHSKAQVTNKIVIPERPFKNIGLEEKETITFQKPKTMAVNLLMDDDNSVSTASYSDRDDFDFNSMSCDDDASIKNSNEKNLKSNSSESSSSRATAKTFENKSLIMGRIFKNASTKAKPTTVKSVGVQKDHTPKADLNQLFDELRGDARAVKAASPEIQRMSKDIVTISHAKDVFMSNAKTCAPESFTPNIHNTQETKRRVAKAPPKKAEKQNKKPKKDFGKLQSELGMSQEEIEKLIDEGQRKSKRRCATNRSKKLVETWSSDEYEEFLSTKDIIALIEEQEKKEQRRKRKNSVGGEIKEKSLIPMGAITPAESSTRRSCAIAASSFEERNLKSRKANTSRAAATAPTEKENTRLSSVSVKELPGAFGGKTKLSKIKPTDESTSTSKAALSQRGKKPVKNTRHTTNRGHQEDNVEKEVVKKNTVRTKTKAHIELSPTASETDDNLYLLDLKRNINNNINSNSNKNNRAKKDKSGVKESSVKEAKEDVTVNSFKPHNRETEIYTEQVIDSKKRNASSSGNSGVSAYKKNKGKRKPQAEKSPVRKRKAAEKLYYWSSSSDEDFGRINEHEPEFENTEQYQKHGWIVGDSHKKLVTLLAIAKGNKKQVDNCGVKKKVSKRKS